MNMNNDQDYYAKRQQEEQELARRATDPCIRRVHEDMARKYAELARAEPLNPAINAPSMTNSMAA